MKSPLKLLIALFCIFCCINISAKEKDEAQLPEYELQGNGTGTQGTYLVNVTIYHKDRNASASFIGRAAVHGVLFRGFTNKDLRQRQKPLAGSPSLEVQHHDFFQAFFAQGGQAASYTSEVGPRKVVKSGKLYKITATVSVNKDQLRKDLEDAGVIKKLGSAF